MVVEIGQYYRIKCGWGWTKAKLEYIYKNNHNKTVYSWVTSKGFRFISYDHEDTKPVN